MENMHKVRAGIMRVLGIVITCLFSLIHFLTHLNARYVL